MKGRITTPMRTLAVALIATSAWACDERDLLLPSDEEAAAYFADQNVEVELTGNVVRVTAVQSTAQLRRGGELWAKVGPYIYLFSEPTRELLTEWNGVAAVRVTTRTSAGTEIATVLMTRDALNDVTWRRALNIAGLARRDGTSRVTRLSDLVQWGEDHTEFEYSPRWVEG